MPHSHTTQPRASSFVTLGEVAAHGADVLTLACLRCEREGRLKVARLVAERGEGAALATVMDEMAAGCSRRRPGAGMCGLHWPGLASLLGV